MTNREQAHELFKAKSYAEAAELFNQVVEANPSDENSWQYLVLSNRNIERYEAVINTCKDALRAHPRSAWLWRELGNVYVRVERLGEAESALGQARRLEPQSAWLWRYYGQLYRKQKNYGAEAKALEELVELEEANSTDLNQLGIAHHDNKNYGRALEFYRRSALVKPNTAAYFNMGLVFNDTEVSQDADAADAYRRALRINPAYTKAQEKLAATKSKLTPLAERALAQAHGVVRSDERYQHYLNPFEVLQLDADIEEIDVKARQRSKKKLLQELDLNDGRVSWLDEQPLDKSRVLAIEGELDDLDKQEYHRMILQNEPLLRFLTHGDIRHFLYSDDYFPEEALDLLDQDEGFRAFVSGPFATQYNAVLSRAIDKKALAVVEVLFDGRRWVEDADLEKCLSGAFKKVRHLADIIRSLEKESEKRLVGFPEVQNALNVHGIVGLFNLLPAQFRAEQTQMVAYLRSLAINCHNKHGQTAMSKSILSFCKQFHFKSHALNERLEEDYKKIEELLAEQAVASVFHSPRPAATRTPQAQQSLPRRTEAAPSLSYSIGYYIARFFNLFGRIGRWVAFLVVLCVGGFVCNKMTETKTKNYRSTSTPDEYSEPYASRPSGEIQFPTDPVPNGVSAQEPWRPPPDARIVETKPTAPILDESWEDVSYSNGEAPECFNYTPRYDRELDNQLRVTVGGGTDVVIKVMEVSTDRCIRYVYVKSRSTYSIRNIPQGRYYLKIAYGKRWVEKKEAGMCIGKFASNPLYEKGEDILDFRTRSTGISYENGQRYENYEIPSFEIQLDVVTTGFSSNSLNTDGISEAEFNQ
jgi:tetratricopeptide (TPR) repeat protein